MSNIDWTSKLREQLADYQEPVSHDLWASIEQSLAQNEIGEELAGNKVEQKKEAKPAKNAQVITMKRWTAAAAAIALLGVGGSYVYLHQEDVERGNSVLASLPAPKKQQTSSCLNSEDSQSSDSVTVLTAASSTLMSHLTFGGELEGKVLRAETQEDAESQLLAEERPSVEVAEKGLPTVSCEKKDQQDMVKKTPYESHGMAYNGASASSASAVYRFCAKEKKAGVSLRLSAENLTPSMGGVDSSDSYVYAESSSSTMLDPMPGVIADPTVAGIHGEDYLLASYKAIMKSRQGEAKHHAPVSVGLQVAFDIAPRLSLSTGFIYTRASSDFKSYMNNSYNVHQVLHYVGIPVGLNYELWQSGGFHAYVMAGAEADYNVKNDTDEEGVKKKDAERDRVQFSGKASLGAQYDITPRIGLYVEPGAKYYLDNGSSIENTFKDKKLNFNLQFGLKLNL